MKFAHMADCHVGGWREPAMREANAQAFITAIKTCINEKIEFLLIAGDLFNTSFPAIDSIRIVVEQLKLLKDHQIPVYIIAGSHDFSPSGKTMLDVLESAGLVVNVVKGEVIEGKLKLLFTTDPKTGIKITGMLGKKGGLEKNYYYDLLTEHLEQEKGTKIFMFHSAITELKPPELEDMDAMAVSLLPKNFNYYAGGHVHVVDKQNIGEYTNIIYPGPTFPNNFSELEKLKQGSIVIVEDGLPRHVQISPHNILSINVDAKQKTPPETEEQIISEINKQNLNNTILTIRIQGQLKTGQPTDINFKQIIHLAEQRGAYFVLKNTTQLTSKTIDNIQITEETVEKIEEKLITEHAGKNKHTPEQEKQIIKTLLHQWNTERDEGERTTDFEQRIKTTADETLRIDAINSSRERNRITN
jgi:DNA repair protein SbcD/Mre11